MIVMVVISDINSNQQGEQWGSNSVSERNSFNPLNYYLSLYEKQEKAIKEGGEIVLLRYPDGGSFKISTLDPEYKWHKEQIAIMEFFNETASYGANSSRQEAETAQRIFANAGFIRASGEAAIPLEIQSRIGSSALKDETLSQSNLSDLSGAIGQTSAFRSLSNDIVSLQDQLENHPAFFTLSIEQLTELKNQNNLAANFNFTQKELASIPVGDLKSMINYLDRQA